MLKLKNFSLANILRRVNSYWSVNSPITSYSVIASDWSINRRANLIGCPLRSRECHREYIRSERSERSIMKTGSTRLSLAYCADKLLARSKVVRRRSAGAVHRVYLARLYSRYPGLEDRDFVVDQGVWLCSSNK